MVETEKEELPVRALRQCSRVPSSSDQPEVQKCRRPLFVCTWPEWVPQPMSYKESLEREPPAKGAWNRHHWFRYK